MRRERSHRCGYERCRRPRIDRVTETPQETHSVGYPISQQTNSGFNAPGFAIGTDDPFDGTIAAVFSGKTAPIISGGI